MRDKELSMGTPAVGGSSLLVIFAVLCLTVFAMNAIALRTEGDINYAKRMRNAAGENRLSIAAATAHAACTTAADIGADAVITVSQSGTTARLVSRFHPDTPVIACLLNEQVQRQMALYFGVTPILMPYANNTDELIELAVKAAEQAGLVSQSDLVVLTAGLPVGISGTTNMIKVHELSKCSRYNRQPQDSSQAAVLSMR